MIAFDVTDPARPSVLTNVPTLATLIFFPKNQLRNKNKENEYDQERLQLQIKDQPMAPRGRVPYSKQPQGSNITVKVL